MPARVETGEGPMESRLKTDVSKAFEFVDDGRTFTCRVEAPGSARTEPWWWFRVSTGDGHRYAPFRAAAGDTQASVQSAIVAYYDALLARRALPAPSHWQRRGRGPETTTK
jgi:hypothetical protein